MRTKPHYEMREGQGFINDIYIPTLSMALAVTRKGKMVLVEAIKIPVLKYLKLSPW